MELRAGPSSPDALVDLKGGRLAFRALVKDGATYRNEGEGWYPTDSPPGIGLDPRTAALLPELLRHASGARDILPATIKTEVQAAAEQTRALAATAAVADMPGVVAVDGESFTELTKPVELTFDAAGRLSGLVVTARNTNLDTFDLIVVTDIAIRYDAVPTSLPDPEPALPAADAPVSQP